MSHELEAAAADALGGLAGKDGAPVGGRCANCGTLLLGPWCYRCGQAGEDFHRSIWRLVGEAFEGLLHFDGRLWVTLPGLLGHPGRLTRAYVDGHRAPQIPPLRLFLVVLVAVFIAGTLGGRSVRAIVTETDNHGRLMSATTRPIDQLTDAQRAETKRVIDTNGVFSLKQRNPLVNSWLRTRIEHALDDPERFKLVLEQWSERFGFLALPLAAGLLSLLFMFNRRFYVFDHTIFSLHSLSAVGLLLFVATLFSNLTGGASYLVLLAAPVHLFAHMRGVYATSVMGTLLRMALLFVGSLLGAFAILLGLILVGLSGMA